MSQIMELAKTLVEARADMAAAQREFDSAEDAWLKARRDNDTATSRKKQGGGKTVPSRGAR